MKRETAIKISIFGVTVSLISVIISLIFSDKFGATAITILCSNVAILCCNIQALKQKK